jgi:hypothetical protein
VFRVFQGEVVNRPFPSDMRRRFHWDLY